MKTSLKQLGHFSEVLCGKGFWGHVVCNGMLFIHQSEYEVLTLKGVGGYPQPNHLPSCYSSLIRSHYSL